MDSVRPETVSDDHQSTETTDRGADVEPPAPNVARRYVTTPSSGRLLMHTDEQEAQAGRRLGSRVPAVKL